MGIQNDNTNNETQKVFPVCYTVALWTWQGRAGEIGIPLLETTKNRRASVFTSRNAERPWEEECQGYHETVLVSRRFWATVSYAFIGDKHVEKWSTLIGGCLIVEKQNPQPPHHFLILRQYGNYWTERRQPTSSAWRPSTSTFSS